MPKIEFRHSMKVNIRKQISSKQKNWIENKINFFFVRSNQHNKHENNNNKKMFSFAPYALICVVNSNFSNEFIFFCYILLWNYDACTHENNWKKKNFTHFFVGQLFATSLLANLMTFVVTTRCTITAIVFLLTTDAFAATFALLLCLKHENYTIGMFNKMQTNLVQIIGSHHKCATIVDLLHLTLLWCVFFNLFLHFGIY